MSAPLPPLRSRYAHAIFCEDVRIETSGQQTLVGAYSMGTNISAPGPITLAKLTAIIWFVIPIGERVENGRFVFTLPDGQTQETAFSNFGDAESKSSKPNSTRAVLTALLQVQLLSVNQPGNISVHVEADGELYGAGTLEVSFTPLKPEASPASIERAAEQGTPLSEQTRTRRRPTRGSATTPRQREPKPR